MSIGERIKEVLEFKLGRKGKVVAVERLSGINYSSWQSMLYGRQRATSEMIEFVCRQWPECAYWIATGTLPEEGLEHKRVSGVSKVENLLSSLPQEDLEAIHSLIERKMKK